MKRQLSVAALFLLIVSGLAVGEGIVPTPNIVSSQIVTYVGPGGIHGPFTATLNINTAYNLVVLVVTCDLYNYGGNEPCVGVDAPPTDQHGIVFTPIEYHFNTNPNYLWTEQEFYAVVPNAGSEVITFYTAVQCVPLDCTWNAQVEQIQGIQADVRP